MIDNSSLFVNTFGMLIHAVFAIAKVGDLFAGTTRAIDRGEKGLVGLPGGKVDSFETLVDALKRESTEEGWSLDISSSIPIHIAEVEGKTVAWFLCHNVKRIKRFKEICRISPILLTRTEVLNSGFGNNHLPI